MDRECSMYGGEKECIHDLDGKARNKKSTGKTQM
jgi:hypothetical protein